MITVIVVLLLAGLLLWAIAQAPLDPWIMNLIRVVVVVACVLYVLSAFGLLTGISLPATHARIRLP